MMADAIINAFHIKAAFYFYFIFAFINEEVVIIRF